MGLEVLTTDEFDAWTQVLKRCGRYDFYHLPKYHALAEQMGEGAARLFVWTEQDYTIALPLLLRPLDELPGAEPGWTDATSVYGYAGPIQSHSEVPAAVVNNFQQALREELNALRVVTLFSRLNTFLPQADVLAGLGECQTLQKTVSIDLTLPLATQRAGYRQSLKAAVNKVRRAGVTCVHDRDGAYLDDFVRIYHETMHRVEAGQQYYFTPDYFTQTLKHLGTSANLFMGMHEGRAVCGAFFIECGGIVQNHLSGTLDEALPIAPMKLLLDEARVWATGMGYQVLHLGGGVTPDPHDPLLHFKAGFSTRQHDFNVWRWILAPDAYRRLGEQKSCANEQLGVEIASAGFFPAYRALTVRSVGPAPRDVSDILVGTSCQLVSEQG